MKDKGAVVLFTIDHCPACENTKKSLIKIAEEVLEDHDSELSFGTINISHNELVDFHPKNFPSVYYFPTDNISENI